MLKGEGVVNLTMMFLEAWNFYRDEDPDFSCYLPESKIRQAAAMSSPTPIFRSIMR